MKSLSHALIVTTKPLWGNTYWITSQESMLKISCLTSSVSTVISSWKQKKSLMTHIRKIHHASRSESCEDHVQPGSPDSEPDLGVGLGDDGLAELNEDTSVWKSEKLHDEIVWNWCGCCLWRFKSVLWLRFDGHFYRMPFYLASNSIYIFNQLLLFLALQF